MWLRQFLTTITLLYCVWNWYYWMYYFYYCIFIVEDRNVVKATTTPSNKKNRNLVAIYWGTTDQKGCFKNTGNYVFSNGEMYTLYSEALYQTCQCSAVSSVKNFNVMLAGWSEGRMGKAIKENISQSRMWWDFFFFFF